MGAFKHEATDAPRGRGSHDYVDVSPRHRCPVCGKGSWCQVKRDGSVVLCKHDAGGRAKVNAEGVTFYIHPTNGVQWEVPPAPPPSTSGRAAAAVCDAGYRAALVVLRLDDVDAAALRARGLTDEAIATARYRTLPDARRAEVARAVVDAVGEADAAGVPGMFWKTDANDRGWWSFSGWSGLLVPVRDPEGQIVALKVRRRAVADGEKRYVFITSASRGGPSAENALHVPLAAAALRSTGRLVLTEGELKADVATHLLGDWPVVSLPGVGAWPRAAAFARAWGARDVVVAFDADWQTNPVVAAAERHLLDALRAGGWPRATVWRWDRRFKGLDDYLAAQARDEGPT